MMCDFLLMLNNNRGVIRPTYRLRDNYFRVWRLNIAIFAHRILIVVP